MSTPVAAPGGDEFRLDTDAARAAVDELRTVYGRLVELRNRAHDLARPNRSARDAVSSEAFDVLALKADGGPGSFTAAMDAGMTHVEQLIRQMDADITRQEEVDAESQRRIAQT